jgi:hypothetical protein
MPVVERRSGTEKVNQGGVSLTVFELMTATFAADEFLLRDDWAAREKRRRAAPVAGRFQEARAGR